MIGMEIRALRSFAGKVSMFGGETRIVSDEVARDLIQAEYAEEAKTAEKTAKTAEKNSSRRA